ncbi:S-adenosylmethionine decarboxylase [Paenibacillus shunpengii]|uniref:S-adenosylmethionine decarboxylase n=1 Tax=Paenibacillus shunpengii TaxID=2054424 RepID=A0ABW5SM80_9BACL
MTVEAALPWLRENRDELLRSIREGNSIQVQCGVKRDFQTRWERRKEARHPYRSSDRESESFAEKGSSHANGYASIDIYTCGRYVQPKLAIQHLYSSLEAKYNNCRELIRGIKSSKL